MKLCNRCGENHLHCKCSFRWIRPVLLLLVLVLFAGCNDGVPIEKDYETLKTFPAIVQVAFIYHDVSEWFVIAIFIVAFNLMNGFKIKVKHQNP